MSDGLKKRLEFPSPLVQAQAVRSLVASVLKEKGQNEKIVQSCNQTVALDTLWEQCCGDSALVRSTCCDALVLLVEQGHADLHYVINGVLNLIPSARNVQGLIKVMGKLLMIQVSQEQRERGAAFTCPYSIRNPPHPYITMLENRPDCWPALLAEVDDIIKQAADKEEAVFLDVLAPFLRFLYCEPQRLAEHALLRHGLLRVLLPPSPSSTVYHTLLLCLFEMVPYMQVDSVTSVLELGQFLGALCPPLLSGAGRYGPERAQLALHLLCASQLSLGICGECAPFLRLLLLLLPNCPQDFPSEQVIMGVSLLLLKAPASQQTALLDLATRVVPPDTPPPLAPVLVLPLLQVLSRSALMEALTDPSTRAQNQTLAQSLLQAVQRPASDAREDGVQLALPLSSWYSELLVATHTLRRVSRDPASARDWLLSAQSALPLSDRVPDHLTLILGHLILSGQGDVCRLALSTAGLLAQADPAQVPALLPVFMFKLGRIADPDLSRSLLYSLPNLATHKFCVSQVLQVLQVLGSSPKMRAVVLRLVTSLWVKQDRVYPELQKMMAQVEKGSLVGKEEQWEQILARAACIRDICKERPYQHGADMLAAITDTLSQCTKQDQATPSALALQGLQELCRAEVVDIRSTWDALSPRLSCDSRPLVIAAVCELLALVPQLAVKTEDYEKFKEQVVSILWSYALSKDPEVARCGFKALSEFPESVHTILHLPEQARPPAKAPEEEEEQATETEEKEEDLSVPGSSYIKLLGLTPASALPGLEGFLTSLLRQEMVAMPRGVYHSALRGGNLRSDQGKTVAGIPGFMLKAYEKNRQPGLKPGLAAGLLLSYDLPVQTDRERRPITRFLVSRGRSYQQMLAALIHEVNIQPSEWHRSVLLPQAWRGFMSRAYFAVLQGRRAELEMLQKQGKENPEELQYRQHCAWLWARDQLTDVVKSVAKDSPVVQGNSILALSGLATVLSKYESSLPTEELGSAQVGPEILSTQHWVSMVMDTMLSVVSSSYRPKGQVFPWFQHRSYSGENTASAIARSCAALALSVMAPVLATSHKAGLLEALSTLQAALPGGASSDESQALQFHTGLALGMLVSSLLEERVSDVSGQKISEVLMNSLDALEACCFNTNLEYNTGCILGMGVVLALLSHSVQAEKRERVALAVDRLQGALEDSAGQGRMLQEVLAYSLACAGTSAFSASIIDGSKAEEIMNALRSLTEESQQTPGFALALGLAVHGLSVCGHGKAEDFSCRLLPAWIKILLTEGAPTMQRLAAVNGLVALVGSESSLIQLKCESELSSQQQSRLNEVIRAITQIVTFSGAVGLQSIASCLLGHLHLAHLSSSHSRTAVPLDFGYLSERSVLRAAVDFLSEAGRKGPEFSPPRLVKMLLEPLTVVGLSHQYPPVNWSSLLAPLMRLNFGEEIQHHCMELVISQSQTSQSASLFLGMWLSPPLVHSLSPRTRAQLYRSLPLWMKHVAEDKLQVCVGTLGLQHFGQDGRPQRLPLCRALLEGLSSAMALPNPSQNSWAVLCSTTEKIFTLLPDRIQDSEPDLYVVIAKCLSEMTDTEIDQITRVTGANVEKMGFVLAYLSSQGRVPLLGLNDVIGVAVRGAQREEVSWLLLQSFYQARLASGPNTGVMKRLEWLLELMGHIRNVAYGTTPVGCGDTREATDFLLHLFSSAVLTWADHSMPLLLGVKARWFPEKPDSEPPEWPHSLYSSRSANENPASQCLMGLPCSIQLLLAKEPWKGLTQKFIDWLFSIAEGPREGLSETSVMTAKAALLSLRNFPEFKRKVVWTRAYGW
ncbi:focadhesin [Conger conger]|uniref:focadhesin n=1 Tax=Conger conger TaxID=82655 RepID=UPI002A5AD113|nr:focadhesin [Conger conger]XP_061106930.1 focadhesin [Conger conger]